MMKTDKCSSMVNDRPQKYKVIIVDGIYSEIDGFHGKAEVAKYIHHIEETNFVNTDI
jgi:hypothetical protein